MFKSPLGVILFLILYPIIEKTRKQISQKTSYEKNRYSYVISYSFKLPDGKVIDSFVYRRGNYLSSNSPAGANGKFYVKYLGVIPYINVPSVDVMPNIINIIAIVAGFFIIRLIRLNRILKPSKK